MKRLVLAFLLAVAVLTTSGCSDGMDEEPTDTSKMFTRVETCDTFDVVYDKDTKVMYVISTGYYNGGNFKMLVNADGTPKLWEGR